MKNRFEKTNISRQQTNRKNSSIRTTVNYLILEKRNKTPSYSYSPKNFIPGQSRAKFRPNVNIENLFQ